MLVIVNGAMKSGSTWLYNILEQIVQPEQRVQEKFQNIGGWKESSIHPDKLLEFLNSQDYKNYDYVVKQHFNDVKFRDMLLKFENIYIFNIIREHKDVVVSYYYHSKLGSNSKSSFSSYYWTHGRSLVDSLRVFHGIWSGNNAKTYCTSYAALKADYDQEVHNIAQHVGLHVEDDELQKIKTATSMKQLRIKYSKENNEDNIFAKRGSNFFRKGVVGDWKNHMNWIMQIDCDAINKYGIDDLPKMLKITAGLNKNLHLLARKAINRASKIFSSIPSVIL